MSSCNDCIHDCATSRVIFALEGNIMSGCVGNSFRTWQVFHSQRFDNSQVVEGAVSWVDAAFIFHWRYPKLRLLRSIEIEINTV